MPRPFRLALAQLLCRPLPPLLAQRMRTLVYPYSLAMRDNYAFVARAQTGSRLRATTRDFHGYPFAIHGYYDWRNIAVARAVASPGDVIVEVGANIGTETVAFADMVGAGGRVHAIEPLPTNVIALEQLAAGAPFRNSTVLVYAMALSDRNQRVDFVVPPEHASGVGHLLRGTRNVSPETVEVECATLDSLEGRIGKARMLFLDTEGEEVKVLRGGRGYIQRWRPLIVLEASPEHLKKAGNTIEELAEKLDASDYHSYRFRRLALEPIRSPLNIHKASNWVCIHRRGEDDRQDPSIRLGLWPDAVCPRLKSAHRAAPDPEWRSSDSDRSVKTDRPPGAVAYRRVGLSSSPAARLAARSRSMTRRGLRYSQ